MRVSQLCGCPQAGSSPNAPLWERGAASLGPSGHSLRAVQEAFPSAATAPHSSLRAMSSHPEEASSAAGPHHKGGSLPGSESPRVGFVAPPALLIPQAAPASAFPNYPLGSRPLILRPLALTGWAARRRWSLSWVLGCKKICL